MDEEMKDFWLDKPDESENESMETALEEIARTSAEDMAVAEEAPETPEEGIEPFVPTDAYRSKIKRGKHRHTRRRRTVWTIVIIAVVLCLFAGGAYAYRLANNPSSFFGPTKTPDMAIVGIDETPRPDFTPTPEPTPTPDPYDVIYQQADLSMMQNIVNVLVIGVDYAVERETWSGKHEYHSDVMMILAINFDENRVDLISLPRDTYANIPGVKGIYKLNAAINCGGGFEAEGGAGFLKVCEAASWMLGGIPVDYYYAVTMPAVKQLVDAVGGVDYDLEVAFTMVGRKYNKGPQHLDGQGVLDYLRVRKNVQGTGDLNRINRQKQMMVALFNTMQEQNLLLKIPDIVQSFSGQLYTNCTLEQTMALALFAYGLSSENIGMYSMGGTMKNIFNWNFCITDQKNRVQIVKTVYDVDVPQYPEYSLTYAQYRWADMVADRYLSTTKAFTKHLKNISPDSLIEATPPATSDTPAGTETPGSAEPPPMIVDPTTGTSSRDMSFSVERLGMAPRTTLGANEPDDPEEGSSDIPTHTPDGGMSLYDMYFAYLDVYAKLQDLRSEAARQAEKYRNGSKNDLKSYVTELNDSAAMLKSYALTLAAATDYSTGKFSWSYRYDNDSSFNEIYVDFR